MWACVEKHVQECQPPESVVENEKASLGVWFLMTNRPDATFGEDQRQMLQMSTTRIVRKGSLGVQFRMYGFVQVLEAM